jgi:8-oxo-dGTP pyrophosphatase MutT (NUDIX family)
LSDRASTVDCVVDERHPDSMTTRVFGERPVYENRWVRLMLVDIQTPDGRRFEHHVVRLQRVAVGLVVDSDRVLMIWRHRFAPDEWGWELPGGIVDQDEDAAQAAGREVEEETGWRPAPMTHLLTFQPMPGMVDTPHELFFANGAERVGEPTDLEEAGRVDWVSLTDVPDLIRKGDVAGSGSLVALLYLLALDGLVGRA